MIVSEWLNSNKIGLTNDSNAKWNNDIVGLKRGGTQLSNQEDHLAWTWKKETGDITAKEAYSSPWSEHVYDPKWWYKDVWKL